MIENLPLNDEDMKNLKLFDIILQSNMSMSTYNLLKKHFMPELSMSSIFILQARILKLSHVTEVSYNCCLNMWCSRSHAGWIPDIQNTEGWRHHLLATHRTQLQPPS